MIGRAKGHLAPGMSRCPACGCGLWFGNVGMSLIDVVSPSFRHRMIFPSLPLLTSAIRYPAAQRGDVLVSGFLRAEDSPPFVNSFSFASGCWAELWGLRPGSHSWDESNEGSAGVAHGEDRYRAVLVLT